MSDPDPEVIRLQCLVGSLASDVEKQKEITRKREATVEEYWRHRKDMKFRLEEAEKTKNALRNDITTLNTVKLQNANLITENKNLKNDLAESKATIAMQDETHKSQLERLIRERDDAKQLAKSAKLSAETSNKKYDDLWDIQLGVLLKAKPGLTVVAGRKRKFSAVSYGETSPTDRFTGECSSKEGVYEVDENKENYAVDSHMMFRSPSQQPHSSDQRWKDPRPYRR